MVQTFFKRSCTIDRLRQGPLAGHIDLLAARLATHGYSRVHSRIQLRLVGHRRWHPRFLAQCPKSVRRGASRAGTLEAP
jgi:hypothetical protein